MRQNGLINIAEMVILPPLRVLDQFLWKRDKDVTLIDAEAGTTVVRPERDTYRCWAGAPAILTIDAVFYLYYRLRDGSNRGYKAVVSKSDDGRNFTPVVVIDKADLGAKSIEGAELVKSDGKFRLLLSFQEESTGQWIVSVAEAERLELLTFSETTTLDFPESFQHHHYKDPVIVGDDLFVHTLSRLYTNNRTVRLRKNENGYRIIDKYRGIRVTEIVALEDQEVIFWDDTSSLIYNWEERSYVSTLDDPLAVGTAPGSGCLRYVTSTRFRGEIWIYYETATEQGGHEIKLNRVPVETVKEKIRTTPHSQSDR